MKVRVVAALSVCSVAVLLLLFMVVPVLSISTQDVEIEPATPVPSPEEMPVFEDDWSDDKEYWFPRNVPETGSPHLLAQELVRQPEVGEGQLALIYQLEYDEALWIHASLNNTGIATKLDDKSLTEFFAFYDKQDDFTPYFDVTFPDGSVKFYEIMFIEVP
ncbi:MAG: hypothetical protein ACRD99_06185 [Nitrososphaera sp.]